MSILHTQVQQSNHHLPGVRLHDVHRPTLGHTNQDTTPWKMADATTAAPCDWTHCIRTPQLAMKPT